VKSVHRSSPTAISEVKWPYPPWNVDPRPRTNLSRHLPVLQAFQAWQHHLFLEKSQSPIIRPENNPREWGFTACLSTVPRAGDSYQVEGMSDWSQAVSLRIGAAYCLSARECAKRCCQSQNGPLLAIQRGGVRGLDWKRAIWISVCASEGCMVDW
jgi:hypothetical protein